MRQVSVAGCQLSLVARTESALQDVAARFFDNVTGLLNDGCIYGIMGKQSEDLPNLFALGQG